MSQIVVHIAAGADDGTEFNNSSWNSASGSQIDVGFDGSQQVNGGLRFTGITIPSGSTIDSAKLTVKEVNFSNGGSLTVVIAAWDTNNPAAFDSTNRPSVVTKTTATVNWTFNSSTNLNTTFDSPDIKTIIQELLDSYGMSSSSIAITITGNGSGNDAILEDLENADTAEAILTINYTASGGGAKAPSTLTMLGVQ